MNASLRILMACGVIVASLAVPAAGDFLNGDLEDPVELKYWANFGMGLAVVEETPDPNGGDALHILASNTCTWSSGSGWVFNGLTSVAIALNPHDDADPTLEMFAPARTVSLEFDARLNIQTLDDAPLLPSNLRLTFHYSDSTGPQMLDEVYYADSNWNHYSLDLPDIDTAERVWLDITATSGVNLANFPDGNYDGYVYEVRAEGWFDNFAFATFSVADIAPVGTQDGIVDGGDLGALLARWKSIDPADLAVADIAPVGAPDGVIDGADLGALLARWKDTSGIGASPAVPEPASLTMLAIGMVSLLRRRNK